MRELLRLWRTNSANSYSLVVSNGIGGGAFGAGTVLSVSANPPPSGTAFAQWVGPGLSNPASPNTQLIMPGTNATVTAIYTNLPAPNFTGWQVDNSNNLSLSAQAAPNKLWVLQASVDLAAWTSVSTNPADINGRLQLLIPIDPALPRQFFRLQSP